MTQGKPFIISLLSFALVLLWIGEGMAQAYTTPSDSMTLDAGLHPTRLWLGTGVVLGADVAAMVGLNQLWYSGYDRVGFHWQNDWSNWAQQDKLGHLFTAFHLARGLGAYGKWAGLTSRQAGLYGGLAGITFQSQIEILDGFSEAWGASWGDIVFNTIGGVAGGLQVAYPELEAITLKYSYHRSVFYDTDLSYVGNVLKDYDGVSHWLVVRPTALGMQNRWPAWLGVSIGYSADGLAQALPTSTNPHQRIFFVGLDLDVLHTIDWPRPWMRTVAGLLSVIRIPMPALQVGPNMKWHWLYY